MDEDERQKMFRTLRGALSGEESGEPDYFCFSASLRIYGQALPFDEISNRLSVQPTSSRRKGERRGPNSPPYPHDSWHYASSLPETDPLEQHIDAVWEVVSPAVDYLKSLKDKYEVDVFCGYRSNRDTAGFVVSHQCLKLFTALEVPFGVSVIIA